ncbi:MAG: hypothetical protein HZB77_13200 [Chloroflexi bacterium]|nr:hypothetical protein [Chloroflexota bacterium]
MQTTKRILIILLVLIITGLLFLPLAGTAWAEGVRVGAKQASEATNINPVAIIKVIVLIGIPGLITVGIRNAVKRKKASAK